MEMVTRGISHVCLNKRDYNSTNDSAQNGNECPVYGITLWENQKGFFGLSRECKERNVVLFLFFLFPSLCVSSRIADL